MKQCPRCPPGTGPKALGEFSKNRARKDGRCANCKTCEAKRLRDYATLNANAAAAGDLPPDARPTPVVGLTEAAPEAKPLPPLEQAQAERTERADATAGRAQLKAALEEIDRLKAVHSEISRMQAAPSILVYDKAKEHRADAVACAILSDWHVEEVVDGAAVHGMNEYSPEIARTRAMHCFRNLLKLTEIIARDSTVRTIWMGWLGDFFSGWIHEELLASNAMAPGDAAQHCKDLLCSGVDFLLRESPFELEIDAIPGNHGRMTKQVHHSDPTGTSLETFMYRAIADRYHANPRVHLNVSGHAMVYRRFFERFNMRLIHGYEVKYGGGVGGITIPLRKATAQWDKMIPATLTALGHFHQRLDGGDHMVNGSLIGYNTFAQAIKASYEEAQQSFFTVHARKGGQKSIVAPIWLDSAHTDELTTAEP